MVSDNESTEPTSDEKPKGCHRNDVTAHLNGQNETVDSISSIDQVVEVHQEPEQSQQMGNSGTEDELSEVLKFSNIGQLFDSHEQLTNILGTVVQRLTSTIEVDTKYGQLTVELDNIEANFKPQTGDQISLVCQMQSGDLYEDEQGEILQIKKIFPTLIERLQMCTVVRVYEHFIALTDDAYVLKEDLHNGTQLHLDDVVNVDLIESKYSKYSRRAIKVTQNFGKVKNCSLKISPSDNQAIAIDGKGYFVYNKLWTKHEVSFKVKNQGERNFLLNSIEIHNTEDTQIRVLEPIGARCIIMNDQITMIFEIHTKFIGESREFFTLNFDTFKITRSITIVVCKSEDEAIKAKLRLTASTLLTCIGARHTRQCPRLYAYKILSQTNEVIPGESLFKDRFYSRKLAEYNVPEKMCQIVLTTEILSHVKDRLFAEYPFLDQKLSFTNYGQRFAALLHLEEIEWNIGFRNYDQESAYFNREGEYLSLSIENLAERRPSIALGDTVNAINPWANMYSLEYKVFQGFVHKIFCDRIYLKFNAMFQQKYDSEDYRLEFHFSRFGLRKQHHAISHICERMGENFLFPSKVSKRKQVQLEVTFKDDNMHLNNNKLSWFDPSLNSIQKMAVHNILRGEAENLPYVIFGPPGTGKTVTLVETILQLVRNVPSARLLVGTPSNSAADLITKHIIASNVVPQDELIRLVSHNQAKRGLIPPQYAGYYATVNLDTVNSSHESMIITDTGLKLRCQTKFQLNHRITISTCSTLGILVKMDFLPNHFTHLLIDEAAQCTEPEIMETFVLLPKKCSQVVLAGDPHQLQPVVTSRYASDLGLGVSFLERLLQTPPYRKNIQRFPQSCGYNPSLLTKLLNNYRALPSIVTVYSKLFYDNELLPMVSDQDSREAHLLAELQSIFEPHHGMPRTNSIFFHGIVGENMRDIDSHSWYNLAEAREIFRFTVLMCRRNVLPEQIGILTPYAKQVKTLRSMFLATDMAMPKIGSVEEFQGQDRDIMLISTVRSSQSIPQIDAHHKLGFLQCNKRMNVAISRARCLMVIFGNPYLLAVNDCWRYLILHCANNNAFFGCGIPPFIMAQMEESKSNVLDTDLKS